MNGRRHRRGAPSAEAFTLLECLLGVPVLLLFLGMAWSFHAGASRDTARTSDNAAAFQSTLVGMEHLRRDLEKMLYQSPRRDLALLPHPDLGEGRGIGLRVPDLPAGATPWTAEHATVSYSLRKVAGASHAYRLVRRDEKHGTEAEIRGCLLRDMVAHLVPCGSAGGNGLSAYQAYLDVTMIGVGSERGLVTHTASMLVALPLMAPAGAYELQLALGGR